MYVSKNDYEVLTRSPGTSEVRKYSNNCSSSWLCAHCSLPKLVNIQRCLNTANDQAADICLINGRTSSRATSHDGQTNNVDIC